MYFKVSVYTLSLNFMFTNNRDAHISLSSFLIVTSFSLSVNRLLRILHLSLEPSIKCILYNCVLRLFQTDWNKDLRQTKSHN